MTSNIFVPPPLLSFEDTDDAYEAGYRAALMFARFHGFIMPPQRWCGDHPQRSAEPKNDPLSGGLGAGD